MDDVDRAATRPTYSCLDVGEVTDTLDRAQPTIRGDIRVAWSSLSFR